ncbi:MAG: S8 family serine peptidase [Bacteroidota bacterium]|nr:S8 family serine peptidase [Bacteroidota bacterium]
MKKIFILIFIFVFIKESSPQNYYFYQGTKVNLEQRTDKFAIILNSNTFNNDNRLNNISSILGINAEVKGISENIYLVNFKEKKSIGEMSDYFASIASRNSIIKFVTPVYYGDSKKVIQIPTDEFIVRLKNNYDKEKLDLLNFQNNIRIIDNVSDVKGFLLKSNNDVRKNALELSDVYFNSGLFEYAEPNFIYPEYSLLTSTPNDPNYGQQWSLNNSGQSVPTGEFSFGDLPNVNGTPDADMNVNLAWDFTTGSPLVKIGIVDTGIDSTHPDFQAAGHLLAGYDAYYNKNSVPRDSGSHGTGSAGFIGAVMNNSIGVAGIAPRCQIISIRIYNAEGTATVSSLTRAFDTARVRGIDILSNGWGGGTAITSLTNAINNAAINGRGGLGCIILFASGNDGHNPPIYPSVLANVVSVGASTQLDQRKAPGTGNQFHWGGNYGEDASGDLDVVTPSNCYTTDVQGSGGYTSGDYNATFWGTSCSCPNAAGVAALILSVNISQTRLQVIENLYRGCDKIDNVSYSSSKTYGRWTEYNGYGRVNAYNSVRLASGVDVTSPTINHKNIFSVTSTYPTSITAEIIDQNGSSVPSSGINQPVLFFRLNKNNTGWSSYDSLYASANFGNNFTFKIPCAGYETQVQYYIRARDNSGNTAEFPRGAPDPFWLCYYAVGTLTTATNKINAFTSLDANASYSPVVSFGNFSILNTKVRIYLRHTYISDEIIELNSPITDANNNRKCLFSFNGGEGDNITGAEISDQATQFWNSGSPPYTNGLFKGEYLLNGLNGTNANGNWKILNYDAYTGDVANYDSVRITFTKTTGITSPSARLNSPVDSILNFGTVSYGDSVTKNFYLKNDGTASLIIHGVTFTGTLASKFSLVGPLPGAIAPDDSGLFVVKLNTTLFDKAAARSSEAGAFENATMNISNNDPDKSTFKVSLQTDNNLSEIKHLTLKVIIQGFYENVNNVMIPDTVRVYLRNSASPFAVVDSSIAYLNSAGDGIFNFYNAANGVNYYIQVIHRNSIETWSNSPGQVFVNDSLNYDFTTNASKAFGNNLIAVDNSPVRYAVFGGDINRDGSVDISDLSSIENAAAVFLSGYVQTDLNGDNFVDLSDLTIADNNAFNFVSVIRP